MNVGATVAAADTGEGGNRVPVAVTVTEGNREINVKEKIYLAFCTVYNMIFYSIVYYVVCMFFHLTSLTVFL